MRYDYNNLKHLLGSYLHQDFDDEFLSEVDAVRAFVLREPLAVVRSASAEIDLLLKDEWFLASPDSVLFELGCYYDPGADGMTAFNWLKEVQRILMPV